MVDISNQQEKVVSERPVLSLKDTSILSAPVSKKRSIGKVLDILIDIPLQNNGSLDILEVLKIAVRDFDQEAYRFVPQKDFS